MGGKRAGKYEITWTTVGGLNSVGPHGISFVLYPREAKLRHES